MSRRHFMQASTSQSLAETPRLAVPSRPEELASHYDLTVSHPEPNTHALQAFDSFLAAAAQEAELSCAVIHDNTIHQAIERLQDGRLTIALHLDYYALWHVADDPYAR